MFDAFFSSQLAHAFWLFLPAGIANMTPPIVNKIPLLNSWKTPIDLGKTVHGQRILGDNKTWRGLVYGTITGGISAIIINNYWQGFVDYAQNTPFWPAGSAFVIGCALGAGALIGDAVESYFKRRARVPAGNSWFPFDQIDYIVGGLIISLPFTNWQVSTALYILGLFFGLHLLVSYIGYLLGFKDKAI